MHQDGPTLKTKPGTSFPSTRADVRLALEAGFSMEEIHYMLDIPTVSVVDGEGRGIDGWSLQQKDV